MVWRPPLSSSALTILLTEPVSEVADNTPVIIGVGQYSERVGQPGYAALSYMDLGGRALEAAIADAKARNIQVKGL